MRIFVVRKAFDNGCLCYNVLLRRAENDVVVFYFFAITMRSRIARIARMARIKRFSVTDVALRQTNGSYPVNPVNPVNRSRMAKMARMARIRDNCSR